MIYATTMALVLGAPLDLLRGDPRWLPHPIRGIGLLTHALERLLRKNSYEKVSGCLLVLLVLLVENPVRLVRRLSNRLGIPFNTILAGNGATELLYFWLRTVRPRTAALLVPTFSEYRKALESVGADNIFSTVALPYPKVGMEEVIRRNPDVIIDMGHNEMVTESQKNAVKQL